MTTTILIVDDTAEFRQFASLVVHRHGYATLQARDGREGFEMAKAYLPDLIISDYTMPHADGYDLLRNIRTTPATAHIPFILIFTTSLRLEELHKNRQWIEDASIFAPYRPAVLIEHVNRLLQQKSSP